MAALQLLKWCRMNSSQIILILVSLAVDIGFGEAGAVGVVGIDVGIDADVGVWSVVRWNTFRQYREIIFQKSSVSVIKHTETSTPCPKFKKASKNDSSM